MHMLVALQSRISAHPDLEIAQLAAELVIMKQHLPGNALKRRGAFILVG